MVVYSQGRRGRGDNGAGSADALSRTVEAQQRVGALLVRPKAEEQRCIHVVPVREHVERHKRSQPENVLGVEVREHDAKARRRAAVGDHIEDGAKRGGLLQCARRITIGSVEQLRDQIAANRDAVVCERHCVAEEGERDPGKAVLIVVEGAQGQAALLVDTIQDQRQVVVKSLEANYQAIDGLAGATILGDGRVALIIDVDALTARRVRAPRPVLAHAA